MKSHTINKPYSRKTPGNKFIFIDQEIAKQILITTSSVQAKKEALVGKNMCTTIPVQ